MFNNQFPDPSSNKAGVPKLNGFSILVEFTISCPVESFTMFLGIFNWILPFSVNWPDDEEKCVIRTTLADGSISSGELIVTPGSSPTDFKFWEKFFVWILSETIGALLI